MTVESAPSLQERYAPNGRCFGCGPANPIGLRIGSRPSVDDLAILVASWTPTSDHEAFDGVVTATGRGTFVAVRPDHPAYDRW